MIIAVPWQVSNSDTAATLADDDDDRDADDMMMMMIDVFHLTHSITHSLSLILPHLQILQVAGQSIGWSLLSYVW